MKTKAALLLEQPGKWEIHEVDLDEPSADEVQIRMVATGLCHSDDHQATADIPVALPTCGGHEGAGVVEAVGAHVTSVAVGDHIVTSWLPVCGRCRMCASGQQNLCDNGARLMSGTQRDGSYRMHLDGRDVGQMCFVSTFAQHTVVPEISCIKIDPDVPLELAALLSCGVPTGWGSAVNAAAVQPGEVVIVAGVGGIGINAVQGARFVGASHIIAVDPTPFKREFAAGLGATASFADLDSAADYARSLTNGQGADSVILSIGVITAPDVEQAIAAIRKGGTVVVTSAAPAALNELRFNLLQFTSYQKRLQGALFGAMSPTLDIPRLLGLWRLGQLELESLITATYTLDQINEGYADLRDGRNIRGVILHDS
jgi:NDMA-dependent alcohol dehydrogenase